VVLPGELRVLRANLAASLIRCGNGDVLECPMGRPPAIDSCNCGRPALKGRTMHPTVGNRGQGDGAKHQLPRRPVLSVAWCVAPTSYSKRTQLRCAICATAHQSKRNGFLAPLVPNRNWPRVQQQLGRSCIIAYF
jgi:hypothetical protein